LPLIPFTRSKCLFWSLLMATKFNLFLESFSAKTVKV
jgi:hypothetical protein